MTPFILHWEWVSLWVAVASANHYANFHSSSVHIKLFLVNLRMSRRRERLSDWFGTLVSSPKRASNTAPFWTFSPLRGSTGATITNDIFCASLPESCRSSTSVPSLPVLHPDTFEEHNRAVSIRHSESPVEGQRRSWRSKSDGSGQSGRRRREAEVQTSQLSTRNSRSNNEATPNDEVVEIEENEVDKLAQLEQKVGNLENNLSFVLKLLRLHETFLRRKFQVEFEEYATPLADDAPRVRSTSPNVQDEDIAESSATFHARSTSLNAGGESRADCNSTDEDHEDSVASDGLSMCSSPSHDTLESLEESMRTEVLAVDEKRTRRQPTRRTKRPGNERKSGEMTQSKSSTRSRDLECPICHKTCRTLRSLRQHKAVHDPEKKLKCPLCPKTFHLVSNLQRHKVIHQNERRFKCHLCPKSFNAKSNLLVHERIHTGERPFKCHLCPKAFFQKGNLRGHERIHTGERPFKCTLCENSFRWMLSLKQHKLIHESRNPQLV